MKTRWIFWIVAVIMILSIFYVSQGADKFYYGSYFGRPEQDLPSQKDSLRFNINHNRGLSDSTIHHWTDNGLRAIVGQDGTDNSPTHWAKISHYTLWEAEGLDQSWANLKYDGGTLVNDGSASGGKSWRFTGPDLPRLIQTGPTYYQEPEYWPTDIIYYTAEFRLRYLPGTPLGPMGPGPPPATKVCSLMVVETVHHSILKDTVLYKSDFDALGGYKPFKLADYTVPDTNRIEFQIYWYGIFGALYIDYVKVYDQKGWDLIEDPEQAVANDIKDYVSQDWVDSTLENGDTVVYRWYLRDEPPSIDLFATSRYIDNLLREVSTERVGFQAFNKYNDDTLVHEYFLRQDPEEYHVDLYPMRWLGQNFSGEVFQYWFSYSTSLLNSSKCEAENRGKDFWVTISTFAEGPELHPESTCCPGCSLYYEDRWYCFGVYKRLPTPYEVRLQTYLAFCYGADAILNFSYLTDTMRVVGGERWLRLGLYDKFADSTTAMWREIRDFTGPRVEALGPIFNQLDWQGACSDDEVGSFIFRNGTDTSYIYNIVPYNHFPPYVEVGFFKDGDSDYFMLVNRRCLSSEGDSFRVFIQRDSVYQWNVEDVYSGSTVEIPRCGHDPQFTVSLEPGEGKLFRFYPVWSPWHKYILVPQQYSTIQDGIDAAEYFAIVLVDTGTYFENIDFKGESILVTSKFHTTGDTSYISRTIIDGSDPDSLDSASVVRFVSGESSCACIKGFTLKNGSGTISHAKNPIGRWGGGIVCDSSSPTITNNIIISNRATYGGGIFCYSNSSPKIAYNIIQNDTADYGGGIFGGGINSQITIANNVISQNRASYLGGGMHLAGGIITNNTIVENSAGDSGGGGGIIVVGSTCQIVNNIIAYCAEGGVSCGVQPDIMSYNDLRNYGGNFIGCSGWGDTTWGTNRNGTPCDRFYNIIRYPDFVDGYHLDDSSPCIDAGHNDAPALPPTDFDGNTRVVNGDEDTSFFVDMGAYEYQPEGPGGPAKIAVGGRDDTETKSSSGIPHEFSLSQNYPNPFNPTTVVEFKIAQPVKVSLKIYNILGQLVRTLVNEEKPAGAYIVYWDGNDKNGHPVSSGIYFYKLDAGDFTEVKKMVLIK